MWGPSIARAGPLLAALLVGGLLPGRPLAAQDDESPPVTLEVEPTTGALQVGLGDLLSEGGLRRAIHQGLPVRIGIRAELWSDGFFDSQKGVAEWKASVVYDPVQRVYRVEVGTGGDQTVGSLEEAAQTLRERFSLPIRPSEPGRYYYLAVVEMETLSLSDLEELSRWLRGDLAPAVAGEEDVEGAVARGVRRLFVRALGLPARRLRLRTGTFEIEGG